jgi:Arc/MetJ-type ribon-helix-helix transcriptional regulator
MTSQQLVTRVPDQLIAAVDQLIDEGVFSNRSDAVRAGLGALVEQRRRAAIGESIVDGYTRVPQADDDIGFSEEASAAMIAEEPW